MKKVGRRAAHAIALTIAMSILACGDAPSSLDPKGPRADIIADLSWLIFGLGSLVFVVVMALLGLALWRASRNRSASTSGGSWFIVGGGIIIPAAILIGLMVVTIQVGRSLADPDDPEPLTIEVTGWQFWWEVHYPGLGITTANEIHIPTGRPVQLRLTSADVIHSFWVPQLAGKMDLVPGQENTFWIEADTAGTYRGQCAEFCGVQHTKMVFHVVAEPAAAFESWARSMQGPATSPSNSMERQGQAIFLGQACSVCHTIEGTAAQGKAAPDLTHLKSRDWIAAGTLLNTRSNLRAFVREAQSIKSGSSMPSFNELDGESLEALLAYLESLE